MIKRSVFLIALFFLIGISALSCTASAYWIWTPETKKFTNPKNAVKDSPKEQFEWAMSFYNAKDFQRAAAEFEKLAKQYEFSESASKAQYYVGLCYENMNKYYLAYQNYQKAIDNFPHIENTEEILAREFAIANLYLSKPGPKVLGTDIMPPLDRAIEIFKKVVENAPYGKFAEEAQFKLGEALKKSERYEEAVQAFHKIVEDYPKSKFVTQAMYEESNCAYKASLKPAYDVTATDNAIKTFEKFTDKNKDAELAKSADATMKRLKDKVAEKSFRAAEFYESQGKTKAAIIYYQDVIDTYPDSTFVSKAKANIEAIKARENKKFAPPIDLSKKKSKDVIKEKKPWNLFGFGSKKTQEESPDAAKAQPKKPWSLFGLGGQKKQPETADQTLSGSEKAKKRPWNIFGTWGQKKAPQTAEEKAPTDKNAKKQPWNLFGLGFKKDAAKKEPAQKGSWKPLNFDSSKKVAPKDIVNDTTVAEAPAVQAKEEAPAAAAPDVAATAATVATAGTVASEPTAANAAVTGEVAPAPAVESQNVEAQPTEVIAAETQKQDEAAKEVVPGGDAPKAKKWKPFNFEDNMDPAARKAVPADKSDKKSPWDIFNFGSKKDKSVKDGQTDNEKPKAKAWKPLNFEDKEDAVAKEVNKSKGWKPLYFGTNDNTMATDRRW